LAVLKLTPLLAALLAFELSANAAEFRAVRLSDDGKELVITQFDGSTVRAPRLQDQDSFDTAQVSTDGRYVGWLALYPLGASYSEPIELVVLSQRQRLHRFHGHFGMVFRWCFWPKQNAVVYAFSFPHGQTDTGFELRRIDDERLLGRYAIPFDAGKRNGTIRVAPAWVRCIPDWQGQ